MFDLPWLITRYPAHARHLPLTIVHGENDRVQFDAMFASLQQLGDMELNVKFVLAPNLDRWGTHHTKMMLLFYEEVQ